MKYKVIIVYSKRMTPFSYSHKDYSIAETNTLRGAINMIKEDRRYLETDKVSNKIQEVGRTTCRYLVLDECLNLKYSTSHILLK